MLLISQERFMLHGKIQGHTSEVAQIRGPIGGTCIVAGRSYFKRIFNALNAPNFGLSRGLHRQLHHCMLTRSSVNLSPLTTKYCTVMQSCNHTFISARKTGGLAMEKRCLGKRKRFGNALCACH